MAFVPSGHIDISANLKADNVATKWWICKHLLLVRFIFIIVEVTISAVS